eukprot:1080731-Pyramimonas_sp.AAC.1
MGRETQDTMAPLMWQGRPIIWADRSRLQRPVIRFRAAFSGLQCLSAAVGGLWRPAAASTKLQGRAFCMSNGRPKTTLPRNPAFLL